MGEPLTAPAPPQEHVSSRAAQGEYYIGEALLARAAIREWATDSAHRQTVLDITGVDHGAVDAAAPAQEDEGEEEEEDDGDDGIGGGGMFSKWDGTFCFCLFVC